MTFSIAGRCARTGMLGIAVSSSSPAVAARCAHVRAGVGVVSTQNITDPTLGPRGLDLMETRPAPEALEALTASAQNIAYRQLALLDHKGGTSAYSGQKTLGVYNTALAHNAVAAGNLLSSERIPALMVAAFLADPNGHLGDRLISAMRAAMEAGGEAGPVHSAGMLIVDKVSWPVTDLRVDWSDRDPVERLAELWALWKPQAEDYVTRALDPSTAPAYGVPGDER